MIEYIVTMIIILGFLCGYDLLITFKLADSLGWEGEINPIAKKTAYNKFVMSLIKLLAFSIYGLGCIVLINWGFTNIVCIGLSLMIFFYSGVAINNTIIYRGVKNGL